MKYFIAYSTDKFKLFDNYNEICRGKDPAIIATITHNILFNILYK